MRLGLDRSLRGGVTLLNSAQLRCRQRRVFECGVGVRTKTVVKTVVKAKRKTHMGRILGKPPSQKGGAKGTRTPDPHTASVVRYQLRHSPVKLCPSKLHHLRYAVQNRWSRHFATGLRTERAHRRRLGRRHARGSPARTPSRSPATSRIDAADHECR